MGETMPQRAGHWAPTRGVLGAMLMWFLMHTGFFLLIPLLSVHFVDELGWAAAFIGLVLATRQFLQQGLAMFGGALADRVGPKRLILLGVLVRSASFVIMGHASSQPALLMAAILAALGGALFDAPSTAVIAVLTPPEALSRVYAWIGVLQNLARTVGPILGALLIRVDFRFVGLAAAGFFLVSFFVALIGIPDVQVSTQRNAALRGLGKALADKTFMVYTALTMGYWFMWVQLSVALPLKATALTGDKDSVAMLFTVNAVTAILLQIPVIRLAQRVLYPLPMLILGMGFMAFGLASVALVHSAGQLYISIFFYSLGTVLITPNAQTVTANLADPAARGAYFGVNSLALAIGGGLGQISGGALVDVANQLHLPALPWLVSAGVGSIAALGLVSFYRRNRTVVTPAALLTASGD